MGCELHRCATAMHPSLQAEYLHRKRKWQGKEKTQHSAGFEPTNSWFGQTWSCPGSLLHQMLLFSPRRTITSSVRFVLLFWTNLTGKPKPNLNKENVNYWRVNNIILKWIIRTIMERLIGLYRHMTFWAALIGWVSSRVAKFRWIFFYWTGSRLSTL